MNELETIESSELDGVTGAGRFDTLRRAGSWAWKQAERGMTALGVYEAGRAAYDWATGGNRNPGGTPPTAPAQPSQPAEGAPQ